MPHAARVHRCLRTRLKGISGGKHAQSQSAGSECQSTSLVHIYIYIYLFIYFLKKKNTTRTKTTAQRPILGRVSKVHRTATAKDNLFGRPCSSLPTQLLAAKYRNACVGCALHPRPSTAHVSRGKLIRSISRSRREGQSIELCDISITCLSRRRAARPSQ